MRNRACVHAEMRTVVGRWIGHACIALGFACVDAPATDAASKLLHSIAVQQFATVVTASSSMLCCSPALVQSALDLLHWLVGACLSGLLCPACASACMLAAYVRIAAKCTAIRVRVLQLTACREYMAASHIVAREATRSNKEKNVLTLLPLSGGASLAC